MGIRSSLSKLAVSGPEVVPISPIGERTGRIGEFQASYGQLWIVKKIPDWG